MLGWVLFKRPSQENPRGSRLENSYTPLNIRNERPSSDSQGIHKPQPGLVQRFLVVRRDGLSKVGDGFNPRGELPFKVLPLCDKLRV